MTPPKKDWEAGIKPTPGELAERIERVRGYLQECVDIVDELFPQEEALRKAPPSKPPAYRMYPFGGYVPERAVVRPREEDE